MISLDTVGMSPGQVFEWLNSSIRDIRERSRPTDDFWLVRFLLLRVLGFTYFFAYLSLYTQLVPLLGRNGLTPVNGYVENLVGYFGSRTEAFIQVPSILIFHHSNEFMLGLAFLGLLISFLLLIGFGNVPMLLANWFIYLSFVKVGQVWYGYGWEIQLLETGLLAVFLVPLWDPRPFRKDNPPPVPVIWLFRWLAMRIYIGSAMIKLKGVSCWHDLTCLNRFFQTQPIPNPISPYMHYLPSWIHRLGVLYTHIVQLLVPFLVFLRRNIRNAAGVAMLSLQVLLILTGNFSFLNWLTIVPILAYFNDEFLSRFMPEKIVEKAERAREQADLPTKRHYLNWILVFVVALLSVPVVLNILSPTQAMNTDYNRISFVNTYGAFGSVRPQRTELVIQGTQDSTPGTGTRWRTYDIPFKPDKTSEDLYVVAPYQPRLSWQMWFASMSQPQRQPWLIHLVWKLLHNDPNALKLVGENPFKENPPEYIRILIYRYEYAALSSEKTWTRERLGVWLPPVSRNSSSLRNYVKGRW
ncbi:MAG: lipase maturation factor family protein [Candidatus Nanosalina sp.]